MQKGSGLGLSVSQTIVRAHGGQVGVRDRDGGGSEFWFTIPITGET
jgi:signal transduction histidine kinase